jgi:DNA-binding NarL/FixJ family response regulator
MSGGNGYVEQLLPPQPVAKSKGPSAEKQCSHRPLVTVVITDDHSLVLEGLRSILAADGGISVVAEAVNATEALELVRDHRPNVLVLGPSIRRHAGNAVTSAVCSSVPDVAVLVFGSGEDAEAVSTAVRAGARGYLCKSAAGDDIVRSVREVAAGWAVFSPGVAGQLPAIVSGTARRFGNLSARENEILELLASGMSNLAISRRLCVAPKTVSNHMSNILAKLGVGDRAAAIGLARDAGLGLTDG